MPPTRASDRGLHPGPVVSVELLELARALGRPHTVQAMNTFFSAIPRRVHSPGVNQPNHGGGDRVELRTLSEGTAEIRAWLNPGQPGTLLAPTPR